MNGIESVESNFPIIESVNLEIDKKDIPVIGDLGLKLINEISGSSS